LDHFDAYLFLYAFNLNHWLVFVIFQNILFPSFQALLVDPGNAFGDVWPGEIPPGWELEWVEDDD
jgi:hypothetical protein